MSANEPAALFAARLEEHRGILLSVARGYCRDAHSREDLVQEMLLQLWRAWPRYDGRAAFSTWTYRIAVNAAIDFYRRESRHAHSVATEDAALERAAGPAPQAPEDERITRLYELIQARDPLDRALMILYLDDRSYGEIADVLGITETNVATKIARIKARLRREAGAP